MGTSTPFNGLKGNNPLLPTWLPSTDTPSPVPPDPQKPNPQHDQNNPQKVQELTWPEQRFSAPRGSFSRFVRSGGHDRKNLGRGVSKYVSHSSGGAYTAARRMGSARTAGKKLLGFLTSSRAQGAAQALQAWNLGHLIGRPLVEVFLGLADHICPTEGTIDAGIAREAFFETIAELAANNLTDLDQLTFDQMLTVFEIYAANSIEARLCNDIKLKTIILPESNQEVAYIEKQLHDFIRRGVSDAIEAVRDKARDLTLDQVSDFVNSTYEQAFEILQSLGDQEANAA